MNRSQKIHIIKVSFIVMFFGSLILLYALKFEIDKLAVILYPLITVLVLVWRSIRDDYDLILLNKLVFDIEDVLDDVEFTGKYIYRDWFTKLVFNKFNLKAEGNLKIHMDIANKGNSEVTLHDIKVKIFYPNEDLLLSIPLFETIRIYNPIENRITEEVNYLRRKHLDKGELHTRIFPLERKYTYMILKIEIYTFKCEASNEYLFYFNGQHFFYAKCKIKHLMHANEGFYFKNRAKIENFLKNC